jgi:methylated-DNA-[protein]-cysteine S-methyltransferase
VIGAAYHLQASPIGKLVIAATDRGVCLVDWGDQDAALDGLEARHGKLRKGSRWTRAVRSQLEEYFSGARQSFTVPVDLSDATPFCRSVLELLAGLPFGQLTSYGELARELTSGPRAVGRAVGCNPVPVLVPCHRVVAADGSLGGYGGGLERKRLLLALEGHDDLPGGWRPRRHARLSSRD